MKTQVGYKVGEQHPTAATDLAAAVRAELEAAAQIEEEARSRRRAAGRLLAQARAQHTDLRAWARWVREAGIDQRGAELLLQLAAGAVPR